MVGLTTKVWLLRIHRGSKAYILTTDPERVKEIKSTRRHWGSLVWTRSYQGEIPPEDALYEMADFLEEMGSKISELSNGDWMVKSDGPVIAWFHRPIKEIQRTLEGEEPGETKTETETLPWWVKALEWIAEKIDKG